MLTERETDAVEWFDWGSPLASLDAVLLLDVVSCEWEFEVDALS